MVVGPVQAAKRAFVPVLLALVVVYDVKFTNSHARTQARKRVQNFTVALLKLFLPCIFTCTGLVLVAYPL